MKYCNLNCKHIHASIIERCGEGIGYEFRCMAQKGMPKVTTGAYCPYDELSETEKEPKHELELYKRALKIACEDIDVICQSYVTAEQCKNCVFNCRHADLVESYLMKAREEE